MTLDISTVSYLPHPIKTKIKKYQKQTSKKFNTIRALDWVPHITIADRVLIPEDKFSTICNKLKEICSNTKPIKVNTKNLRFLEPTKSPFENNYVIFIDVNVTKELKEIHDLIQNNIYKGLKRPSYKSDKYEPHITLAYRDLTKENFNKAKSFFKDKTIKTDYSFTLDNLQLVVTLRNEQRRPIRIFKFKNKRTL